MMTMVMMMMTLMVIMMITMVMMMTLLLIMMMTMMHVTKREQIEDENRGRVAPGHYLSH